MKIVAVGLSHNEADVVQECVEDALAWVDAFVLYDNSTDGTADLARAAGAAVLPGDPDERFDEGLRQYALTYAAALKPDWIVRIDPDEFYPRGVCFEGGRPQCPRHIIEHFDGMGYLALRANVIQFWITIDDVSRGLLMEDERVSVQQRRRWYSVGHTAVVAWRHDPRAAYAMGQKKNVPLYPNSDSVGTLHTSTPILIQTHYTCRSLPQLVSRVAHRRQYGNSFGKYRHNVIIDEKVARLHYRDGDVLQKEANHELLYRWYELSEQLYKGRFSQ